MIMSRIVCPWVFASPSKDYFGSPNAYTLQHKNPLIIPVTVLRWRAFDHTLQQDGRNTRSPQERMRTSAILDSRSHKCFMGFLILARVVRITWQGGGGDNFAIYLSSRQIKFIMDWKKEIKTRVKLLKLLQINMIHFVQSKLRVFA